MILRTSDLTFTSCPDQAFFCYGGIRNPSWILCTSLYDSICFDKTQENSVEHNFQKFVFDSLTTCFNYQENSIEYSCFAEPQEHRLLFLTIPF